MKPMAYSLRVVRLARNVNGRDLIVGDIHGHFTKLWEALAAVGFSPLRDRLISVGDLVDRGPESHLATRWLGEPWFFPVRGNHEDMLCMYRDGECDEALYRQNGGGWFINLPQDEQERIAGRLRELPLAIELETERGIVAVVHADCPTPTWAQLRAALEHPEMGPRAAMACTWSRSRAQGLPLGPVEDVRAVVVGHTPMDRPTTLDNVHFIDTGAWLPAHYGKREFTILDAATLLRAATTIGETA
jgi:serine/threonine protein phosphatase 1